jgi:hypothetical protein
MTGVCAFETLSDVSNRREADTVGRRPWKTIAFANSSRGAARCVNLGVHGPCHDRYFYLLPGLAWPLHHVVFDVTP